MKKRFLPAGLAILLTATPLMAQMMGGGQMMEGQGPQSTKQMMEQQQTQQQSFPYQKYPGMMGGYGMGPGMMGGYGMGPGMMGGYGMGPGMMGGYGMGPGMMGGYGMGPGMMGGYGMGPGMMGGYGMGPGMMGGYGMGPGMMGGYGCGMGPGMMGYPQKGYEEQFKEYQDFLDATKGLRKKMHELRFDYAEALRNPATEQSDLEKMNQEMEDIWKQMYDKKKSIIKK